MWVEDLNVFNARLQLWRGHLWVLLALRWNLPGWYQILIHLMGIWKGARFCLLKTRDTKPWQIERPQCNECTVMRCPPTRTNRSRSTESQGRHGKSPGEHPSALPCVPQEEVSTVMRSWPHQCACTYWLPANKIEFDKKVFSKSQLDRKPLNVRGISAETWRSKVDGYPEII
jgi:hypothetical protein